jgi:hypothetical protein
MVGQAWPIVLEQARERVRQQVDCLAEHITGLSPAPATIVAEQRGDCDPHRQHQHLVHDIAPLAGLPALEVGLGDRDYVVTAGADGRPIASVTLAALDALASAITASVACRTMWARAAVHAAAPRAAATSGSQADSRWSGCNC